MQAQQLWQAVLSDLQTRVSRNPFEHWVRPAVLVEIKDDVALIAAANTFGRTNLEQRFGKEIERTLSEYVGRPITAQFTVMTSEVEAKLHGNEGETTALPVTAEPSSQTSPEQPTPLRHASDQPRSQSRGRTAAESGARPARSPRRANDDNGRSRVPTSQQLQLSAPPAHGLNPRYTYDSYVVGSSNRFAYAASLSVADRPGAKYNPFYVYGGVGLGKTHLIHAIGHRTLAQYPDLVVRYVSSEKFTNDLINALKARTDMEEFRSRYRLIDVLMIDDIQFIAGKEATMEEFFHTFNALQQSGKQVIITSDKPPKAISGLEERLRSRFEGGLMADVQPPDYEMRMAILRAKSEEMGIAVPADVAEYVAAKDQTNIRELEGALTKIIALAELTSRPVTIDLAMEALTDAALSTRRSKLTPEAILDAVATYYGISLKEIQGRARTKDIVVPRQVAMYLIREETNASLVDIGQALGGRDHTTVMHGIGKVERELTSDTALRSQLVAIREALFMASRGR